MGKTKMPLVLASTSPRRHELLALGGLQFVIVAPCSGEVERAGERPRSMVKRLAREKARSVIPQVQKRFGRALILGADTIVIEPGGKRFFGKPKNPSEACRMLRALSGRMHTVLTGYCWISFDLKGEFKEYSRVVTTKVWIRELSEGAIRRYVATGEPMDKAGAYAAQGLGIALIERVSGSYSNVVGLPLAEVLGDLERQNGLNLFARHGRARSP